MCQTFFDYRYKLIQKSKVDVDASEFEKLIIRINAIKRNAKNGTVSNDTETVFKATMDALNGGWSFKEITLYHYSLLKSLVRGLLQVSHIVDSMMGQRFAMIDEVKFKKTIQKLAKSVKKYQVNDVEYLKGMVKDTYPEFLTKSRPK